MGFQASSDYTDNQSRYESVLSALEKINGALRQSLNVKEVAQLSLIEVLACLDPMKTHGLVGTLQLIEDDQLVDLAGHGYREGREDIRLKVGEGVTGQVALTGKALLINDLSESRWSKIFVHVMDKDIRSELVVPLPEGERWCGVLNIESPHRNQFDEHDLRFVSDVATQISIALANAKVYAKLREANENLQAEQLRRISAEQRTLWAEFALGLAHYVNGGIGRVPYWLGELKEILAKFDVSQAQRAAIDAAFKEIEPPVDHVLELSGDLQKYFAKEAQPLHPLELADALQRAIRSVKIPSHIKLVVAEVAREQQVNANSWLSEAFGEIIRNAVKYMPAPQGGVLQITCARLAADQARVVFKDTGLGIPKEELGQIFKLFKRGQRAENAPGFGIGLAFVDHAIRSFDGEVQAASEGLGCGSTFTVTLPILSAKKGGQPYG